ncbi:hypothetical protein [Paenibacillus glycanilyticus]|uniref:Uncharacterized protein n=1 Tax=Paenibacillus glycanilyticus TaxID=126569 RepID=A0ABQ6NFA5_9BACL|nr:hypothetical protein [Paenibacillus glycanilyticus]GMK43413.1 hypothetical protein PghCCS26_05400 [Paenibacillus glycanilyticus]
MVLWWNRWTAFRTEAGSRADEIDRLHAYFKSNGLKSKVTLDGSLKRLHVRSNDEARAKELAASFDAEHS